MPIESEKTTSEMMFIPSSVGFKQALLKAFEDEEIQTKVKDLVSEQLLGKDHIDRLSQLLLSIQERNNSTKQAFVTIPHLDKLYANLTTTLASEVASLTSQIDAIGAQLE